MEITIEPNGYLNAFEPGDRPRVPGSRYAVFLHPPLKIKIQETGKPIVLDRAEVGSLGLMVTW